MGEGSTVVVREDLDDVLRARMVWPPVDDRTVTLLRGPAGSGKSTLLAELAGNAHGLRLGRADLGRLAAAPATDVDGLVALLTTLVYQLAAERPRLRRAGFPRCLLGLLAGQQRPGTHRHVTREELGRLLAAQKRLRLGEESQQLVVKVADAVVGSGTGGGVIGAGDVLVSAFTTGLSWRRTDAEQWWRRHGRTSALDTLVEVNRRLRSEDPAEREPGRRSLVEAFLADLHAAAGPVREASRREERDYRAVVLLDDVERHEAGPSLIRLLCRARAAEETALPLTVIATMGTPEAVLGADAAAAEVGQLDDRSLRRFTPAESEQLARRRGLADKPAIEALHALTCGHPGGLDWVLGNDPRLDKLRHPGASLAELDALLARLLPLLAGHPTAEPPRHPTAEPPRHPTAEPPRHPTAEPPRRLAAEAMRRLERAAAAERLPLTGGEEATRRRDEPRSLMAAALWTDAEYRLDPFLRRLLLLRLAAGPRHAWTTTHEALRVAYERGKETDRALRHTLAKGDVLKAVAALEDRLDGDAAAWVALACSVVRAPRADPAAADPDGVLGTLDGDRPTGVAYVLARLVIVAWMLHDPLTPGAAELRETYAVRCWELAQKLTERNPALADLLYRCAERPGLPDRCTEGPAR